MTLRLSFLAAIAALMLCGCGPSGSSSSSSDNASSGGPRMIEISAGDTMKYDVTSIQASPGEQLQVILTNTGSMPIEAMAHNWILLKAGSDPAAFSQAASTAKDTGYIPDSLKSEIIAYIPIQGPRKSGEVTFKAPATPGEYPYLCSFPAHYQNGMHGVLTVK